MPSDHDCTVTRLNGGRKDRRQNRDGGVRSRRIPGCATKDYAAGKAAVIPAGVYMVHNTGSEPLEFFGAFFGQPQGMTKPLAEGPTEEAPAGCTEVKAAGAAPSGGLPHGEALPGPAGNQLVAADFSQAPPLDCPRLR